MLNDQSLFFSKARPVWDELDALVQKAQRRGLRRLTDSELDRLDKAYRLTTIHLSQIRSRTDNYALTNDLNRLVARAHSVIYAPPEPSPLYRVFVFYWRGFPAAIARTIKFHAASACLFLFAAVLAHLLAQQDAQVAYALMQPGEIRLPGSSREQLEGVLRSGRDSAESEKLMFASFLFAHNTKVGFTTFVTGVLAGIPTVFLIAYNGAMLGAFSGMHHRMDIVGELWAWLLPHGVTELSAIILCGGGGLLLGAAVISPGTLTRGESLTAAGRDALKIGLGVVPMFIAAGAIESFVRQSEWTTESRLLFAGGTAVFWVLYVLQGYLFTQRSERAIGAATS